MKRDKTIIPAIFACVVCFAIYPFLQRVGDDGAGKILGLAVVVIGLIATARIMIFCWQTLLHAIWSPQVSGRGWWIVGHLVLGPIVSIPYYSRHQIK